MKVTLFIGTVLLLEASLLTGCNALLDDWKKSDELVNCADDPCDANATCTEDNEGYVCTCLQGYSGDGLQCVIDCGTLDDPENGSVETAQGTALMAKATYHCIEGYTLEGDNFRTCSSDGHWSGDAPTCQVVDCGILYPPLDGSVDLSGGTEYGDVATYACNNGYRLSGLETRDCLSTGQWNDSPPICLELTELVATMTDSTWHSYSDTDPDACTEESLMAMPVYGDAPLVVEANALPPGGPVIGSCSGHEPIVYLVGDDQIDIVFEGGMGSACPTNCYDFTATVEVSQLPRGTYTVTVGDLSHEVHLY